MYKQAFRKNFFIASALIIAFSIRISYGVSIEAIVKAELENRLDDEGGMGGDITLKSTAIIGAGAFGFVVEGATESEIPVAIKLSNGYTTVFYEREYNCYERLGAMTNKDVEKYGIPFIYHCDDFLHYKTMAMTLLDSDLLTLYNKFGGFSQETLLIIFRDMVRTSKYIHSKGIINQDIKPDNIMIRGADVFTCDFNQGDEKSLTNVPNSGSRLFRSIGGHLRQPAAEHDDMQSLFYSMLLMAGVSLPWATAKTEKEILDYKLQIEDVRDLCRSIQHPDLIEPFTKFYDEIIDAMNEQRLPEYDSLYKMFNDVLYQGKNRNERIVFEWLNDDEKIKAMATTTPTIESITFLEA